MHLVTIWFYNLAPGVLGGLSGGALRCACQRPRRIPVVHAHITCFLLLRFFICHLFCDYFACTASFDHQIDQVFIVVQIKNRRGMDRGVRALSTALVRFSLFARIRLEPLHIVTISSIYSRFCNSLVTPVKASNTFQRRSTAYHGLLTP